MNVPMIRKSFETEILDVAPGRREVVACISTAAIDRDAEVVLPHGLIKKHYGGLTVFYDHDTAKPLGVTQWVKQADGRVLAKYRASDKTQLARDMFALAQDGVLKSYSIGFLPRAYSAPTPEELRLRPELKDARRVYRQWELLEFSLVGIAANPEATMLAISKKVSPQTWAVLGALRQSPRGITAQSRKGRLGATAAGDAGPSGAPMARSISAAEIAGVIASRLNRCDMDDVVGRAFDVVAGRLN